MSLLLSIFNNNELVIANKVQSFLEYFEDEDLRGLIITEKEAKSIIESADIHAKDKDRIILNNSLCQKVAYKFSKSDFVDNNNFTDVVSTVIELIFRVQSETGDKYNDDILLEKLFNFFECRNCCGSTKLLEDYASQIIDRYNNYREKDALSYKNLDFTTFDYYSDDDYEDYN